MRNSRPQLCLLASIVALLFCSCARFPREGPETPVDMPAEYSRQDGGVEYPNLWWESFGDENLNRLIEEAFRSNTGLEQARARLRQAQAVAEKSGSAKSPRINLEGTASRRRTLASSVGGETVSRTINDFGLNLAASYEVDLWGRIDATARAAAIDAQASKKDLETAAMTLAANITELWYSIGTAEEKLRLLDEHIRSSENQLRLTEMRFETGQASALDVWQQRGQLAALRAVRPRLESNLSVTRHQLAILLGRTPRQVEDLKQGEVAGLPPKPETGIPSDLIRNRPDLRAAISRVRSADERVAAAIADRFPAFRISASGGYSAEEVSDLFEDWIGNLAGNLVAPLVDGGTRRAETERSRAVLRERLAVYKEKLLGALKEVEDALVQEDKQRQLLERREHQLDVAEQTLKQARSRYKRGLVDYLSVLNAFAEKQSLQRSLLDDRLQLLAYRVQLYRALGGDFEDVVTGEKDAR